MGTESGEYSGSSGATCSATTVKQKSLHVEKVSQKEELEKALYELQRKREKCQDKRSSKSENNCSNLQWNEIQSAAKEVQMELDSGLHELQVQKIAVMGALRQVSSNQRDLLRERAQFLTEAEITRMELQKQKESTGNSIAEERRLIEIERQMMLQELKAKRKQAKEEMDHLEAQIMDMRRLVEEERLEAQKEVVMKKSMAEVELELAFQVVNEEKQKIRKAWEAIENEQKALQEWKKKAHVATEEEFWARDVLNEDEKTKSGGFEGGNHETLEMRAQGMQEGLRGERLQQVDKETQRLEMAALRVQLQSEEAQLLKELQELQLQRQIVAEQRAQLKIALMGLQDAGSAICQRVGTPTHHSFPAEVMNQIFSGEIKNQSFSKEINNQRFPEVKNQSFREIKNQSFPEEVKKQSFPEEVGNQNLPEVKNQSFREIKNQIFPVVKNQSFPEEIKNQNFPEEVTVTYSSSPNNLSSSWSIMTEHSSPSRLSDNFTYSELEEKDIADIASVGSTTASKLKEKKKPGSFVKDPFSWIGNWGRMFVSRSKGITDSYIGVHSMKGERTYDKANRRQVLT